MSFISTDSITGASGRATPRPETPEPGAQQGRRNAQSSGVQLLDSDGSISEKLEQALGHIFCKYLEPPMSPANDPSSPTSHTALRRPPNGLASYLTPAGLDKWAVDTNGHSFPEETKEELREFLDVTEEGCLTFKGFLQIYQLQTENDEEETWRDLSNHGFDRNLNLVSTRREDLDVEEGDPAQVNNDIRKLDLGGSLPASEMVV